MSRANLLFDDSDEPIKHPLIEEIFSGKKVQVILSNLIKRSLFQHIWFKS